MNKSIIIDTNTVVALLDNRDVHHDEALRITEKLEKEGKNPLLMDCILNEIYTVLARRGLERGQRFSEIVDKIRSSF